MQDSMSQEEIDATLKNATVGQDSAFAEEGEFAAAGVPTQTEPEPATVLTGASKPYTDEKPLDMGNIEFLLDVPLDVSVELGRTKMPIRDMLQLGPGSVIELDKLIGEPVDLLVNNRLIARGEVVVFDENFGIRITDILKPEDRIKMLG